MQNIQESAASACIQRIDPSQVAASRQVPLTIGQLELETEPVYTKQDFERAFKKVSRKVKR